MYQQNGYLTVIGVHSFDLASHAPQLLSNNIIWYYYLYLLNKILIIHVHIHNMYCVVCTLVGELVRYY